MWDKKNPFTFRKNEMVNYVKTMREELDDKAFTLIELIVVMAILAILVLLATPQFLGYTNKAKVANIQNDVAVAEMKTSENLIDHQWAEKEFDNWPTAGDETTSNADYLRAIARDKSGEGLYGKGGKIDPDADLDKEILEDKYKIIPSTFLEKDVRTQLDGTFFANENGDVFYTPGLGSGGESESEDPSGSDEDQDQYVDTTIREDVDYGKYDIVLGEEGIAWVNDLIDKGYVMVNEDDFAWLESQPGTGAGPHWRYDGNYNKVIIPITLNNDTLHTYEYMFYGTKVEAVASNNPSINNMRRMFQNHTGEKIDLSSLNTSSVSRTDYMFYEASNLRYLDVSSFNTSSVTNMMHMFGGTSNLKELDLSSFNTSKVTDMRYMFSGSKSLEHLDLGSFNTSNVTSMAGMFENAESLRSLNLNSFDTSKVRTMEIMFQGVGSLRELDISTFEIDNTTNIRRIFGESVEFIDGYIVYSKFPFETIYVKSNDISDIIVNLGFDMDSTNIRTN